MTAKQYRDQVTVGCRRRAYNRYHFILNRIKNSSNYDNRSYRGAEVRMTVDEFIEWFLPKDFAGCAVERIDKKGHFELSNLKVVPRYRGPFGPHVNKSK